MGEMFESAKTRMTERIDSPQELVEFKLGSALHMEHDVLDALGKLEEKAQSPQLKQLFAHHADETRTQISNLEQSFSALGVEPNEKPCPTMEAHEKEGRTNLAIASDNLVDAVALSSAAETEHYEIAVYESLIRQAEALGKQDIVGRLQENLQQEQHTLEEVTRAMDDNARELARQAA
jgi:ferritin-like metal-binding protein YciE